MSAFWIDPALLSDPDDVRERVREKVSRGGPYRAGQTHMAWKPERGDRVLRRLGLAPFTFIPAPEQFDPMAEPAWSIMMALGWIIWRTPEAVRDHWEAYRAACVEWGGVLDGGRRELGRRRPSALGELDFTLIHRDGWRRAQAKERSGDALSVLMRELRSGNIVADARKPGMSRADIPVREWRDLEISNGRSAEQESVRLVDRHTRALAYEHVEIDRVGVMRCFPMRGASVDATTRQASPTAGDETRAIKALADMLRINRNLGRDAARKLLMESGTEVSATGFVQRIWPAARKDAGLGPARRGPRPKHDESNS